jgi:hypothetical protein
VRGADAEESAELRGGVASGDRDRRRLGARPKRLPSRLLNESVPLRPEQCARFYETENIGPRLIGGSG